MLTTPRRDPTSRRVLVVVAAAGSLAATAALFGARLTDRTAPPTESVVPSSRPTTTGAAPPSVPVPADVRFEGLGFTDVSEFSALSEGPTTGRVADVVATDIDGDSDQDIFVARDGGPDSLFRNNGGGQFADLADAFGLNGGAEGSTTGAAFGDLDGDGCLDAVTVSRVAPVVSVLRNTCWGRFEPAAHPTATDLAPLAPPESPARPLLEDVDGDDDLDVVIVVDDPLVTVSMVLLNDGSADFAESDSSGSTGVQSAATDDLPPLRAGAVSTTVEVGSTFGSAVIAVEPEGSLALWVLRDGGWLDVTSRVGLPTDGADGYATVDTDGDGDLDIITYSRSAPTIRLWRSDL